MGVRAASVEALQRAMGAGPLLPQACGEAEFGSRGSIIGSLEVKLDGPHPPSIYTDGLASWLRQIPTSDFLNLSCTAVSLTHYSVSKSAAASPK